MCTLSKHGALCYFIFFCSTDTIYQIQDTGTINGTSYTINTNNIAWETDRDVRFNNSAANPPHLSPGQVEKPPNWPTGILGVLNGLNNESLIVWFRVSAFPWFRKLYGRIYSDMPASTYTVTISYCILVITLER